MANQVISPLIGFGTTVQGLGAHFSLHKGPARELHFFRLVLTSLLSAKSANMLLPSFLCTLIFTLQCVSAVVVFRNGGKLQAVSTIRDGTQPDPKFPKDPTKKGPASDFDKPDAQGNTPVNGNKGLSVGTDVVSKDNAKKAAPIIEKLRSLPNGAERKKALTDLTTLFNGFIPIFNSQKVWRADIAEDDPDLAVVDDGVPLAKKKDPSHRLLTLRRPIPQKSLASTINNRFGTQRVPEGMCHHFYFILLYFIMFAL
ncbi:hypothetical protein DL96DRAFT_344553 [Flagelloscypha sp. PMI_526]|nr:hypothetical protein DL96DRAFT_344553 [Flagelloscypha sp. PMI_526]